ncbi:cell division site-positioning protein MapZ family protein [Streptococcaceae bacterium ESL0729]|nr:cell division site-positioning protein MapZ family protein [Streptococcaceae bacterium ESL0729]
MTKKDFKEEEVKKAGFTPDHEAPHADLASKSQDDSKAKLDKKKVEQVLDFGEISDMTIEEIQDKVRAGEEAQARNESLLDAYIRENRFEIEKNKKIRKEELIPQELLKAREELVAKAVQLAENLDQLDAKIEAEEIELAKKEEEVLEKSETLSDSTESAESSENEAGIISEQSPAASKEEARQEKIVQEEAQEKIQSDEQVEDSSQAHKQDQQDQKDDFDQIILDDGEATLAADSKAEVEPNFTPNKETPTKLAPKPSATKLVYLSLLAVLVLGGAFLAKNQYDHHQKLVLEQKEQAAKDEDLKKREASFDTLFASFYTDKNKDALKNSSLSNYDNLVKDLDSVKDSSKYASYQTEVSDLKAQITSLDEINSKFQTDVISDGKVNQDAKVKDGADFNINKSNLASLNQAIDSAIALGKNQQAEAAQKAEEARKAEEAKQAEEARKAEEAKQAAAAQAAEASKAQANAGANSGSSEAATSPKVDQDSLSRVPINQAAIADTSNPAWTWKAGVLDNVLNISRQRGYFEGDNYYIKPVNIINGNGYYNLYKSDGTYLFSINCKTGYFFGNASGHALDY